MMISRRQLLFSASVAALASATPALSRVINLPFSFDWLTRQAERLAKEAYAAPKPVGSQWLAGLGYDAYRDIRFKPDKALWGQRGVPFRAQFFHLGALYMLPVELNEVIAGEARPIAYDPSLFGFGKLEVPEAVATNKSLGYAGFRLHAPLNRHDYLDEFMVFLGASYFRGVGKGQHYGLSARGLAIDTALARGEEFPNFTKFWLERPLGTGAIIINALLDSPSATGAYRFVIRPGTETTMDVTCRLFTRKAVEKLGVAPLTSMYAFGENEDRLNHDFRPEVHDSDGLLMQAGNGEWLWRPLINPSKLSVSTYRNENPKGFGLLQRDRNFNAYQDLEANYELRPSLWVEPKGNWGKGSVQLIEIPTDSEIHDNIVAFWVPETPVAAGEALRFDYRLSWGNGPAAQQGRVTRPAEVAGTHVGRQFDRKKIKFVIDYKDLNQGQRNRIVAPQQEVWSSAGMVSGVSVLRNPHTGGWRVSFDLEPDGDDVHELRCLLRQNGRQVSETWSYQWRNN